MRIRGSNRLAWLAAVGVVVTAVGAARLPATPTYASQQICDATGAYCFHEIAQQGFGDPLNSWAWSMEWFNNRLFVGTNRDEVCAIDAEINHALPFVTYPPPPDPNFSVQCAPNPQALPLAAEIWSVDPSSSPDLTQSNWQRVYQSPYTVTVNVTRTSAITMAPRDIGFRGMSVYTEPNGTQALYVSGVGIKPVDGANVPPPSLLRTTTGNAGDFHQVPADPGTTLGDVNSLTTIPGSSGPGKFGCCFRGQVAANGYFYLLIGTIQGGGAVFASATPWQGDNTFWQVTPPDMSVFEMAPFNGHLYLGVQSKKGYSVWRDDCLAPPPSGQVGCPKSDFKQVVPNGGGLGASGNDSLTSMEVYTDPNGVPHLYVGTDGTDDSNVAKPAEIIRINQDDSWDLIVGNARTVNGVQMAPLSGLPAGFGWSYNVHMWRMEDYQGTLYVGTNDDSILYYGTSAGQALQPMMGFDLWASTDGVNFTPITQNGFGDPFSYGLRAIKGTPYGLFVGSANHYHGLRIWQGTVPQGAGQLAPQGLQSEADSASPQGGVALSWDAPHNATLFHVYRSDERLLSLPAPRHQDAAAIGAAATFPHTVWAPGSYTQIGTTSAPYFVDHSVPFDGHHRYYVVAQDAAGHLSTPSNVAIASPSIHPPSFGYVRVAVSYLAKHGHMSAAEAAQIKQTLHTAHARLQAGDAQGAHDLLDGLRGQVLSSAPSGAERLYAEKVSMLLGHLERRITLVLGHVLSAQQL